MKRFANKLICSDIYLLWFINNKIRCEIFDQIMPLITHLGGAIFTISFTLSLLIFGNHSVTLLGLEVALSLSLSHVIVHFIKRKVNRPRPHTVLEIIEKFDVPICNYSFPSGHTTAAFAVGNILAMNLPHFANLIMGLATLVAVSRMYVGVHYPSDVLVGFLIADISSKLIHPYFL